MALRGLEIRELERKDYGELVSLWRRAGLPFRPGGRDSRRELERQLGLPTSIYLKAVLRGGAPGGGGVRRKRALAGGGGAGAREAMVGVALGTHDGRKGWVNRLAVLPEHRRRGVGRALVRELEKRFRALGLRVTAALVEDWNTASLRAFRAMGYELHRDIIYLSRRRSRRS
ncbi:MAG: GNAT family N-acetyltransferase [Thermoplasmatota archaeon]